jgi:hypothetical protein
VEAMKKDQAENKHPGRLLALSAKTEDSSECNFSRKESANRKNAKRGALVEAGSLGA